MGRTEERQVARMRRERGRDLPVSDLLDGFEDLYKAERRVANMAHERTTWFVPRGEPRPPLLHGIRSVVERLRQYQASRR